MIESPNSTVHQSEINEHCRDTSKLKSLMLNFEKTKAANIIDISSLDIP